MGIRSFADAMAFISRMTNYERMHAWRYTGAVFKLDRVRGFFDRIGRPHDDIRCVHVAGTKGKGSTCAIVESMCRQAGLRTGLYTSPHLIDLRERISVCGKWISRRRFASLMNAVAPHVVELAHESVDLKPSFFEIITAIAFLHFRVENVDVAVIEVGLGGRLDSTNIITPMVSVITQIGLDHMKLLGETIPEIAREKAGIIKAGVPVVTGAQKRDARRVISAVARRRSAPLFRLGREIVLEEDTDEDRARGFSVRVGRRTFRDLRVPLAGAHQRRNAALAVAVAHLLKKKGLKLSPNAVRRGLEELDWHGRAEIVRRRPTVILDGAHNEDSIAALVAAIRGRSSRGRIIVVFGIAADKSVERVLELIAPEADLLLTTRADSPRAIGSHRLARLARRAGARRVRVIPNPREAVRAALGEARPDDVVCVTGSFYLAGEVAPLFRRRGKRLVQTL